MARANAAMTVLLVEDEELISELFAAALAKHGFAVHAVTSADAAWRYIDSGAELDVLFTDINLPGRMNGAELARRARQLRPDLPIVYASGRYRYTDIGKLVPRSIFVSKPYDPDDIGMLLARLTEAIGPG